MAAARSVILHYHLFKNAGTSVDKVLRDNFGSRWVTAEFDSHSGDNSAAVAEWIADTPEAVAFSTHTAMGPVPQLPGVRIVSVLFLRDPVARIVSAYRFETRQTVDTYGANLAKRTDLGGYVRTRLARPADRQCRNFQTHRLASLVPGPGPELERALAALERLSVVGRVEDFDGSMRRLQRVAAAAGLAFDYAPVRMNVSAPAADGGPDAELLALLEEANADDRRLISVVEQLR